MVIIGEGAGATVIAVVTRRLLNNPCPSFAVGVHTMVVVTVQGAPHSRYTYLLRKNLSPFPWLERLSPSGAFKIRKKSVCYRDLNEIVICVAYNAINRDRAQNCRLPVAPELLNSMEDHTPTQSRIQRLLTSLGESIVDKPPYTSGVRRLPGSSFSLFYKVTGEDGNAARFRDP